MVSTLALLLVGGAQITSLIALSVLRGYERYLTLGHQDSAMTLDYEVVLFTGVCRECGKRKLLVPLHASAAGPKARLP